MESGVGPYLCHPSIFSLRCFRIKGTQRKHHFVVVISREDLFSIPLCLVPKEKAILVFSRDFDDVGGREGKRPY